MFVRSYFKADMVFIVLSFKFEQEKVVHKMVVLIAMWYFSCLVLMYFIANVIF